MKKIIIIIVALSLVSFKLHNVHISLTKVTYKEDAKSVQVLMRCFINDITVAINAQNEIESEMATDRELTDVDTYLKEYLTQNFAIYINGKLMNFNYLGKEYDEDIVYFYLEIENVESIKNIEVKNAVLFHTFDDQQNLIKLKIKEIKKTFYLSNNKDKEMLKID